MADDNGLKDASVKTIAANWLLGQPFNNVILVAILAGGAWVTHYGMTKAIPDHLNTIQTGYEKIETRQSEQLASQQQAFEKVASTQQASNERIIELITEKAIARNKSATASIPGDTGKDGTN